MRRVLGMALIAAATAGLSSAAGQEQTLLDRCWTPQALAGTEAELPPSRVHAKLDLAALRAELLPAMSPVPQSLRGSIRSVVLPPGEKLIALTFDLCEANGSAAGYDGRIVDLLRAQGVKATFFAGGKWMETHPERAAQLIADANFEIGNHGLRHFDMAKITGDDLKDEIGLTQAAYMRARNALLARQCAASSDTSHSPPASMSLIRFPYGHCNAASLAAVADQGEIAIQWDIVTGDPDPHRSAAAIAETILTKAHPGAIIVAHANGRGKHTAEALALAIPKLKQEGYSFVTVSELLAAGTPVIASNCYLDHPGASPHPPRVSRSESDELFGLFRTTH
jgi:peptidoglycan-N-acetylglucosamine deacetylase